MLCKQLRKKSLKTHMLNVERQEMHFAYFYRVA